MNAFANAGFPSLIVDRSVGTGPAGFSYFIEWHAPDAGRICHVTSDSWGKIVSGERPRSKSLP
jgi:hypothetical protein